jgi:uncharacterized protein YqeY
MTDSALKSRITEDMKNAMRAQAKDQLQAIRLILAALKQKEVDERITLTDQEVFAILDKMLKQRRDSLQQFEAAGREDLAAKERFEIGVIQTYLPAALSEAEIDVLIKTAISSTGASTPQDMGKVMAIIRPQVQGRADMGAVSQKIKAALA